jgi:hypothetical protein
MQKAATTTGKHVRSWFDFFISSALLHSFRVFSTMDKCD